MTVKQLIEHLSEYNQEAEILCFNSYEDGLLPVGCIVINPPSSLYPSGSIELDASDSEGEPE